MVSGLDLMRGLVIVYSLLVEYIALKLVIPMLARGGALRPNYRGEMIPVATGITFPLALLVCYLPYPLLHIDDGMIQPFLLGVCTMSLLGLVDDLLGTRDSLGFKGHISSLLRGRLTTGGLKLLIGGMLALFITLRFYTPWEVWWSSWYWWLIDALIIALATNFINLFDLRPGRAVKGFLIFAVLALILGRSRDWWLLLPLFMVLLVYFPYDLRARSMMGDAGSNVLGFALGFLCVTRMDHAFKLGTLAFLLAVNLLAERLSLTTIIEKVAVLRFIDNLGRENMRSDQ